MAAVEGLASDIARALAPGREDVEVLLHDAAAAPERQQWERNPAADVGFIVDEIDRGGGTIILASGVDRGGVAEAAQIFGQRLRRVGLAPAAPAAECARKVVV